MLVPRFVVLLFSMAVTVLGAGVACGQEYPNRPIRMVTSQAGSGSDFAARLIAQGLPDRFGQRGVVDNRGIVAAEIVAQAAPDGYTLLLYSTPLWISPLIRDNVRWDPLKDFAPVTLAVNAPNLLVVHPSVPVKSVKELVALAKARPGELNYGSGSTGSTSHLSAELFKAMAGVNIVRVPYRGVGPALVALVGGQMHLIFPSASAAVPYLKSGKLRALAVTTAQPSALAPGLPTVAAAGLPGYESDTPLGIFAPAGTPSALIDRLNREIVWVLNRPDVKERLFNSGVEVIGSSPKKFAATLKSEIARWGKLIKDAGLHE